jgi:8-oxo-dGTP pyrophosphatase MutT (NUDIX family)
LTRVASPEGVPTRYDLPSVIARLRGPADPHIADDDGPRAAVAAVLRRGARDAEDAELLFIRRADREGDPWSGHMAFPGGRRDPGDRSLLETALRETREEVGLDLSRAGSVIVRLPDVQAYARGRPANLHVAAYVFAIEGPHTLAPNEEVAEALWMPLGPIVRGEGAKPFDYRHEGITYKLPSLDMNGRIVWGLTYRMLEALTEKLHRVP